MKGKMKIREKLAKMLRYERHFEIFPLVLLFLQSAFLGNFIFKVNASLLSKVYGVIHFVIIMGLTFWVSQECEQQLEEIDKT